MDRHTISVLTNDHPGVLQRVANLFSRRGYNIESLTVGGCEIENLSRMTIVAAGNRQMRDQLILQLNKLIDVIQVTPLDAAPKLSRELMLMKLRATPAQRQEIISIAETFHCTIADVGMEALIVQVVGKTAQNNALLQLLKPYGVLELTRTGETAMSRP
ncbi:acetolactate synthase small subunit [Paenibacillus ihbetae]|uniref:Acetolactate synthase small subunit n=1 Tax=Paenibacillus ihbetae TaxID=1870820 RepID=A0ABX3JUW1_9BACL|nr:acetolactate synthase small subunit [Paenibacillus ihbetae]OOC61460.1 acetolactate synthase small subunit [Paenibacillus ihbetae]